MNDDTKFILHRIDALEGRLMNEIKELQEWKNKALGIISCLSVIGGGLGAIVMQYISKHT